MTIAPTTALLGPGATLREQTYRIEAILAVESGMGELYRAVHVPTKAARALKRLRRLATNAEEASEGVQLFEREAQWLANLCHPGIPRVYETFTEAGAFFFVMDWVDGQNTEQILAREGAFAPERCVDLANQLAEILAYLHRHEPPLIHRDLKPANVMLTSTQRAVLIDFGIARHGERGIQGRKDTVLFATEHYAPPEQQDASFGRTTPRSDVFAYGMTLIHLVTGKRPGEDFRRDAPDQIAAALDRHLPSEKEWLSALLLKCVELDPQRRFADGAAVAAALHRGGRLATTEAVVAAPARSERCSSCAMETGRGRYLCGSCGAPLFKATTTAAAAAPKVAAKLVEPPVDQISKHASAARERKTLSPLAAELAASVARLDFTDDFDVLRSEARLRFKPLPHQLEAARDVLRHKRGRALLADEVGLGKTVESLIVLEEYRSRGLVRNALILTPPTLVEQWQEEIVQKLGVDKEHIYRIPNSGDVNGIRQRLRSAEFAIGDIMELRYANRAPALTDVQFDMVIVDEVHLILSQVRNKSKPNPLKGYQLIQSIQKKFVLLLSATPIQNTIVDLFELVSLTRPGQLFSWVDFKEKFIESFETRADGTKFPVIRQGPELRKLLRDVVVRHRRDEVMTTGVFPRREARMIDLVLSPAERELYDELRDRLAIMAPQRAVTPTWSLDLADALGAHPKAFAERAKVSPELSALAKRALGLSRLTKLETLVEAVNGLVREGRKVLVFSRFPAARDVIAKRLESTLRVRAFHKGIKDTQRVSLLRRFGSEADVLVVDDSAAVGLNLQFCDVVVNYDLPWNPFLIEQRVGRVQRIGQRRPSVWIVNFRVKDTIDEVKLDLCNARLRMFEGVFGQSPTILGAVGNDDPNSRFDLKEVLRDIYLERDAAKLRQRVAVMCRKVDEARAAVDAESARANHVFEEIRWSGED